jgi:hypothetical protein
MKINRKTHGDATAAAAAASKAADGAAAAASGRDLGQRGAGSRLLSRRAALVSGANQPAWHI